MLRLDFLNKNIWNGKLNIDIYSKYTYIIYIYIYTVYIRDIESLGTTRLRCKKITLRFLPITLKAIKHLDIISDHINPYSNVLFGTDTQLWTHLIYFITFQPSCVLYLEALGPRACSLPSALLLKYYLCCLLLLESVPLLWFERVAAWNTEYGAAASRRDSQNPSAGLMQAWHNLFTWQLLAWGVASCQVFFFLLRLPPGTPVLLNLFWDISIFVVCLQTCPALELQVLNSLPPSAPRPHSFLLASLSCHPCLSLFRISSFPLSRIS